MASLIFILTALFLIDMVVYYADMDISEYSLSVLLHVLTPLTPKKQDDEL